MLSDQRTRATLRLQVRRELKDANEHLASPRRWWTDTELNQYLDEWMQDVARQFNLLSTATSSSVGSATATITTPSTMLRIGYTIWDGQRLLPTTVLDMDTQHPNWRNEPAQPNAKPRQIIEVDNATQLLYPIPGVAGTLQIIGPRNLAFSSDSDVCPLPPWMYFSCRLYCAAMAYMRAGPNQDARKSARYKARYQRLLKSYRMILDARFASYGPRLKPASGYEGAIMVGGGR